MATTNYHEMMANYHEIILMCDEQIDYGELSETVLRELALSDELFIANSSLVELRLRKSCVAIDVASIILEELRGDCYLQAAALHVLFAMSKIQMHNYLRDNIESIDPYLLNVSMEIMVENQSEFKVEPAASNVRAVLNRLDYGSENSRLEALSDFVDMFGPRKNPR
ncbi:MAG: hypothetical protein ACRC0L_02625 [Angustibacter sp.]